MKLINRLYNYFTKEELILWTSSLIVIIVSFMIFDRTNFLILIASLIGVTSLIFSAKGNPFGQFLIIVFSLIYALISFNFSYYGEVATYLGMTMPMALFSFISWMKNPYSDNKSQVKISHLTTNEWIFMIVITIIITLIFYYILLFFNTPNIILSTISITTSFIAVYLTFRRSPYYAIGYAANDLILILLWTLAAFDNTAYISVVVCFVAFLINDLYGYINWKRMAIKQAL